MPSSGKGSDAGTIAKAAGVAVATGIGWSIVKSITGKKNKPSQQELDSQPDERQELLPVEVGASWDSKEGVVQKDQSSIAEEKITETLTSQFENDKEDVKAKAPVFESSKKQDDNILERAWGLFGKNKKKEVSFKSSAATACMDYEIQKGDTLWRISHNCGITVETLKAANGLSTDDIYAGDKLVIPPKQ